MFWHSISNHFHPCLTVMTVPPDYSDHSFRRVSYFHTGESGLHNHVDDQHFEKICKSVILSLILLSDRVSHNCFG